MRAPASLGTNKLPTVDDHSHSVASGTTEDPDNNVNPCFPKSKQESS